MKNVFLIGMPSSGKTTLGKELSRYIRYRFLDTDKLIVKAEGMSVKDIFETKGEPYFREVEAQILRSIRPDSKIIVSTGGGMPCFLGGIDYIKKNGVSVFLNVPAIDIFNRLSNHKQDDRPMFKKGNPALLTALQEKLDSRMEYYSQADIIISEDFTAKHIVEKLSEFNI
jgi:shikimate kinase